MAHPQLLLWDYVLVWGASCLDQRSWQLVRYSCVWPLPCPPLQADRLVIWLTVPCPPQGGVQSP